MKHHTGSTHRQTGSKKNEFGCEIFHLQTISGVGVRLCTLTKILSLFEKKKSMLGQNKSPCPLNNQQILINPKIPKNRWHLDPSKTKAVCKNILRFLRLSKLLIMGTSTSLKSVKIGGKWLDPCVVKGGSSSILHYGCNNALLMRLFQKKISLWGKYWFFR